MKKLILEVLLVLLIGVGCTVAPAATALQENLVGFYGVDLNQSPDPSYSGSIYPLGEDPFPKGTLPDGYWYAPASTGGLAKLGVADLEFQLEFVAASGTLKVYLPETGVLSQKLEYDIQTTNHHFRVKYNSGVYELRIYK